MSFKQIHQQSLVYPSFYLPILVKSRTIVGDGI
nr:MAG TPA: hypothetical protein [Caudoviricetes sp.]